MKRGFLTVVGAFLLSSGAVVVALGSSPQQSSTPAASTPAASTPAASTPAAGDPVARGKYLVGIMGCHHCHTPVNMGPKGPEPVMSRMLSGHPDTVRLPPAPSLGNGPWNWAGAATMTAFSGPWGTSFAANLTPDQETGLGSWTEQMFIDTMRTGRHQGRGRQILPPMPWENLNEATDDDLKAIFAYLRSIPAVRNKVPQPVDPPEAPSER